MGSFMSSPPPVFKKRYTSPFFVPTSNLRGSFTHGLGIDAVIIPMVYTHTAGAPTSFIDEVGDVTRLYNARFGTWIKATNPDVCEFRMSGFSPPLIAAVWTTNGGTINLASTYHHVFFECFS